MYGTLTLRTNTKLRSSMYFPFLEAFTRASLFHSLELVHFWVHHAELHPPPGHIKGIAKIVKGDPEQLARFSCKIKGCCQVFTKGYDRIEGAIRLYIIEAAQK